MLNCDKMVFVNLTNMEKYAGYEENVSGGGRYVDDKGFGHEMFNFLNDDGKCYGYATPHCKVNLSKICPNSNSDVYGNYIDDVLVVFTCTVENHGRLIAGFYDGAQVYSTAVNDNRQSRFFDKLNNFVKYNMICDVENAVLIDKADRKFLVPHSKSKMANNGVGHGQHSIWYASRIEDAVFKNKVIAYLEKVLSDNDHNNEYKYHHHDESKKTIVYTKQQRRSLAARNECIELKGCYCNICGFDFMRVYGELGKGYIEVHHITPVGELSSTEGYEGTDPEKDLVPLCSNCHSMIHRKKIPYRPAEIKEMLNQ